VRRFLKSQRATSFHQEVIGMEDSIKGELRRKQKVKENFSSKTQRLFGIVKNIYVKVKDSGSTINSPAYKTIGTLTEYKTKVEQNKAEAIVLLRRQLAI
jgi:hypothetical protein